MWSWYKSIRDSVAPGLGSVRKAPTAATDSTLWLSWGCTDEGWTSATLRVRAAREGHSPKHSFEWEETGPCLLRVTIQNVYSNLDRVDFCLLKLIIKNEACVLCVCLPLFHFSDHSFLWCFIDAPAHDRLEIKTESCNTESEDSNTGGTVAQELPWFPFRKQL